MNWQTFDLPRGTLEVREDPANTYPLAALCRFGARNNPKRGFLFVSTLLGKHLPAQPSRMLAIHQYLAAKIHVDHVAPTLFIGMAETGVGLSYGVYDAWSKNHPEQEALFIHSTRYLLDGLAALSFEEGHSHAPSQALHLPAAPAQREKMRHAQTLVLLDDEVSTGKTFANLWHALRPHTPHIARINIVTLTDFMDSAARETLNQTLALPITHISAARAEWRFDAKTNQSTTTVNRLMPYQNPTLKPLAHQGRAGIERPLILSSQLLEEVTYLLAQHPKDQALRILGTGEFMHIPYLLALHLEQLGRTVSLQSSTRSPILEFGPIEHTQYLDDPYGQGDPYFIYNAAPDDTKLTLILHETAPNLAISRLAEQLGAYAISCAAHELHAEQSV